MRGVGGGGGGGAPGDSPGLVSGCQGSSARGAGCRDLKPVIYLYYFGLSCFDGVY